jgi:hypothetical protein
LHPFIVPVTVAIVLALFADPEARHRERGRLFGPVMCVWFVVIALLERCSSSQHPQVLGAIDPAYAIDFVAHNPSLASWRLARSCSPSRAPRRSTRIWGISARPHPPRVAVVRDAGPGPQLFRARRAAARGPDGHQESVLSARRRNGR